MARFKKYPGTIEARGDAFRVILYAGGERHTYTLRDTTRKGAEQFAKEKHGQLTEALKRESMGLPGALRFSELLERWKTERLPLLAENTQAQYRSAADRFSSFFVDRRQDPDVADIRQGHVKEFLSWRRATLLQGGVNGAKAVARPASNRTLAKDRTVLHNVFEFAVELELRDGNPVSKVKPPKADPRDPVILLPDQYEALLRESAEDHMLLLYVLALGETGGRCESEVLWLQWEDVDFEGGFLYIRSGRNGHRTKSGKGRWVPMTRRLREAMREHFARFRFAAYGAKRSEWVFHHTRKRRRATAGQRVASFRRSFANAARRAKLPAGFRQHDLRHRRVTTWLAEGQSAVNVKEAMGHADLRTTMGYTHLSREHLRALVAEPIEEREKLKELGS